MAATVPLASWRYRPGGRVVCGKKPEGKCIVKKSDFEYWYDTSRVTKTAQHLDVFVWEIYKRDSATTYKHIRFERASGLKGYGECKGYKYNKQVSDFDFSKMGFIFSKPQPEEKKLFKLLNK